MYRRTKTYYFLSKIGGPYRGPDDGLQPLAFHNASVIGAREGTRTPDGVLPRRIKSPLFSLLKEHVH